MDWLNPLRNIDPTIGPAVVLVVALLFLCWQILMWRRFGNCVQKITKNLDSYSQSHQPLSISDFNRLNDIFTTSKILSHEWSEFSETIVENKKNVFNTINFSQFINVEYFLDRHFGASLHRKAPTIVTSVGLFFTFVFIIIGLTGLKFGVSGEMQKSIQDLVSNLGGKFASSVSGILFSIVLTGSEHFFHGSSQITLEKLIRRIDQILSRKPQEAYFLEIQETLVETNHKQTEMLLVGLASIVDVVRDVGKSANDLRSEIAQIGADLIETVKCSIEKEINKQTESLVSGLSGVTDILREVDRSTGDLRVSMSQFGTDLSDVIKNSIERDVSQPLQTALKELQQEVSGLSGVTDILRDVERNTGDLRVSMSQFGTDLSDVIKNSIERDVSQPLQAALKALQQEKSHSQTELLRETLNQFRSSLSESTGSEFAELGTTVSHMAQVLRDSSAQSVAVSSQVERLLETIANQTERSRESSDQQIQKVQSSITKVVEDLVTRMSTLAESSGAAFAGQTNTVNKQIAELASSVGDINEAINKITTRLDEANHKTIERIGNVTSAISKSSSDLTERQNKMTRGLGDLIETISETLKNYKALLPEQEKVIREQREVAKIQSDAQEKLQHAQSMVVGTLKQVSERDSEFRETQRINQDIIARFQDVFSGVETGLAKILDHLATNIEHYNQATTSTLSTTLDRYDAALTTSTAKLQLSVEGLSDALDDFEELFTATNKKAG